MRLFKNLLCFERSQSAMILKSFFCVFLFFGATSLLLSQEASASRTSEIPFGVAAGTSAAESSYNAAGSSSLYNAGSSTFALLRIVLVLALAAAAIYGLVYLLKKQGAGQAAADPYLKVLSRAPLSARSACAVVSVGDKAWLVGLSDESVSPIAEITDKELVDAMLLDSDRRELAAQNRRLSFSAMLARLSAAFAKTAPSSSPSAARSDRLNRLEKL